MRFGNTKSSDDRKRRGVARKSVTAAPSNSGPREKKKGPKAEFSGPGKKKRDVGEKGGGPLQFGRGRVTPSRTRRRGALEKKSWRRFRRTFWAGGIHEKGKSTEEFKPPFFRQTERGLLSLPVIKPKWGNKKRKSSSSPHLGGERGRPRTELNPIQKKRKKNVAITRLCGWGKRGSDPLPRGKRWGDKSLLTKRQGNANPHLRFRKRKKKRLRERGVGAAPS